MLRDTRFLRQFAADGEIPLGYRLAQQVGKLAVKRAVARPRVRFGSNPKLATCWFMRLAGPWPIYIRFAFGKLGEQLPEASVGGGFHRTAGGATSNTPH